MPVKSAAQKVREREVGLARNFERKTEEDCEKAERARATVKKAKTKPAPVSAPVVEKQEAEKVIDASNSGDEQSDQ